MQSLAIIGLCVLSAVVYGILHDQVTARVCLEYFTVAHPPVFDTQSPTLLAFGWGVIATWWVGLILGVPLAVAARVGKLPKRDVRSLIRPVCALLVAAYIVAGLAGVCGLLLGRCGVIRVLDPLARMIPPDRHAYFLADLWAHTASYAAGFVGGIVLVVVVWRSRRQPTAVDSSGRCQDNRDIVNR